jgi:hypothetical protein
MIQSSPFGDRQTPFALLLCAGLAAVVASSACGDDEDGTTTMSNGGFGGGTDIGGFDVGPTGTGAASTTGPGGGGSGGEGTVSFVWDNTYSGAGSAFTKDVAVDTNGNVVVVGSFQGEFDFGGGVRTSTGSGSNTNVFVAKYDSAGAYVWDRAFGSGVIQSATAVTTDSGDNIALCGFFIGQLNFGGNNLSNNDQFPNVWVAKLAADNSHVFSASYPNANGTTDECHGIASDDSGNTWATGWFQSAVNFGGNPLTANGMMGDRDVFLLKLDPAGAHLFSQRYGGAQFQLALDVVSTSNGSVAIVGYTEGDIDFGGGNLSSPTNTKRAFVARFDLNGNHAFSSVFSGGGDGEAVSAAIHRLSGDVIVAGNFKTSIDAGSGSVDAVGANNDIFVGRYDPSGATQWVQRFGGMSSEEVADVAVDSGGWPVLTGKFNGDFTVNGSSVLMTAGNFDGFLVRLGPTGNGYWGFGFGDDQTQAGTAVTVDAMDSIVIVGDFWGDVDLGSGNVGGTHIQDIFVAKYGG